MTTAKHILEGHVSGGGVISASFNHDGSMIVSVSSSDDNTVRVWDARTGAELMVFTGHTGAVTSASFNDNGTQIVSCSDDNTIRVWDVTNIPPRIHTHIPCITNAELNQIFDHTLYDKLTKKKNNCCIM